MIRVGWRKIKNVSNNNKIIQEMILICNFPQILLKLRKKDQKHGVMQKRK